MRTLPLLCSVAALFILQAASAANISNGVAIWNYSTFFPTQVQQQSCTSSMGYVYCIGGFILSSYGINVTNSTFYAALTSNGFGSWIASEPYPVAVQSSSCVAANGYLYCIGGFLSNFTVKSGNITMKELQHSNQTYFAPLTDSGIGAFLSSTPYPMAASGLECVPGNGYIYCGGAGSAYYAPISSNGIGTWDEATNNSAPMQNSYCSSFNGYIYCISASMVGNASSAYYARLSGTGIGAWQVATPYPALINKLNAPYSCPIYDGYIYCITSYEAAGTPYIYDAYYAKVSDSGIGPWSLMHYPALLQDPDCMAHAGYLYCSGLNASTDYAALYSKILIAPYVSPIIAQLQALHFPILLLVVIVVIIIIVSFLVYFYNARRPRLLYRLKEEK